MKDDMIQILILYLTFFGLNKIAYPKGYRGPYPGLFGIIFVGIVHVSLSSAVAEAVIENLRWARVSEIRFHWNMWMLLVSFGSFLLAAIIVGVLPERNIRNAAKRGAVGHTIVMPLLVFFCAALFLLEANGPLEIGIVILFGTAFVYDAARHGHYMDKNLDRVDARSLIAVDRRPFILFLRSFVPEVFLQWEDSHGSTLEGRIAPSIFFNVGPFVALGDPNDYLPTFGASKHFAGDSEWTHWIQQWIQDSGGVLIALDMTASLQWEVMQVVAKKEPQRVFILIDWEYDTPLGWAELRARFQGLLLLPEEKPNTGLALFGCTDDWTLFPLGDEQNPVPIARELSGRIPGAAPMSQELYQSQFGNVAFQIYPPELHSFTLAKVVGCLIFILLIINIAGFLIPK